MPRFVCRASAWVRRSRFRQWTVVILVAVSASFLIAGLEKVFGTPEWARDRAHAHPMVGHKILGIKILGMW